MSNVGDGKIISVKSLIQAKLAKREHESQPEPLAIPDPPFSFAGKGEKPALVVEMPFYAAGSVWEI